MSDALSRMARFRYFGEQEYIDASSLCSQKAATEIAAPRGRGAAGGEWRMRQI